MTGKYKQNGEVTSSSSHRQKNESVDNVRSTKAKMLTATPAPNERKENSGEKIIKCAFGKKEINAVDVSVHSIN